MAGNTSEGVGSVGIADFVNELSQSAVQASADLDRLSELSPPMPGKRALPLTTQPPADDFNPLIMDIPVTLKVVLGTARMPVAAISKLVRGSIVKLENSVGDPVDIFVNGRLLARGEVVVLDEGQSRFGVKLTEVGRVKDKIR
jgi:flagellar motor switch protein FliN/FliY